MEWTALILMNACRTPVTDMQHAIITMATSLVPVTMDTKEMASCVRKMVRRYLIQDIIVVLFTVQKNNYHKLNLCCAKNSFLFSWLIYYATKSSKCTSPILTPSAVVSIIHLWSLAMVYELHCAGDWNNWLSLWCFKSWNFQWKDFSLISLYQWLRFGSVHPWAMAYELFTTNGGEKLSINSSKSLHYCESRFDPHLLSSCNF